MGSRSFVTGLLVLVLAVSPAAAQTAQSGQTSAPAQPGAVRDSLKVEISPELQRSLDELAATLDRLGRRIANDPELRTSALRAAQTFVTVAQVMVVQQADLMQEALKEAAERLAEITPPASPPRRSR